MGETAPKALRGSLLVVCQTQAMFGYVQGTRLGFFYIHLRVFSSIFLSNMIELGTHHLNSSASWRIPLGLQVACGLILLIGFYSLPESP